MKPKPNFVQFSSLRNHIHARNQQGMSSRTVIIGFGIYLWGYRLSAIPGYHW